MQDKGATILAVDDSPATLQVLTRHLVKAGYVLHTCASVKEAGFDTLSYQRTLHADYQRFEELFQVYSRNFGCPRLRWHHYSDRKSVV